MNVISRLDAEWQELVRCPTARRSLRRWGREDPVLAFPDFEALAAEAERRDDPAATDAILSALASRAPVDHLAARVLLQLVLPGCKALVGRYRIGDHAERVGLVVAAAFERIRTYPYDRRPQRIAANILLDVRQALLRSARPSRLACVSLDQVGEARVASPAIFDQSVRDAVGLMSWAVKAGVLDEDAARLITMTRLGGVSVSEVAGLTGEKEQTVRKRRLRAEARLREVVGAS